MANGLYDKARERFLTSQIDWGTGSGGDVIKCALVRTGGGYYNVSLTDHEYWAAVTGVSAVINTPATLTSKSTGGGAARANQVTFSSVASGATVGAIMLYKWVSSNEDSPLVAYIDTATGLPITGNGGDIIVTWDSGVNGIFRL